MNEGRKQAKTKGQTFFKLDIDFSYLPKEVQKHKSLFGKMGAEGPIPNDRLDDLKKIWIFFMTGKPLKECD